jgi:hypothetical protein
VVGATFLAAATPAHAYEYNGRKWPAMPIGYWVNPAGQPALAGGLTTESLLAHATAAWSSVGCADVAFQLEGTTDATWANDGQNTIFWVASDWMFQENAAGATLWIPTQPGEPMEVDLALNAADLKWVIGGGDALQSDVVDPVSVITHELGHWLGFAHATDQFATMYQALLPAGAQATLAADDKAGLCGLYPAAAPVPECATDEDCRPGETCAIVEGFTICAEQRDPVGAHCDKSYLNCDGLCVISFYECSTICAFTTLAYDDGYCAPLCGTDLGPCPDGWACTAVPSYGIEVCLIDDTPPEPTPEEALDATGEVAGEAPPDEALDEPLSETPPEAIEDEPVATPDNGEPGADLADSQDVAADAPYPPDSADGEPATASASGCSVTPRASSLATLLFALVLLRRRASATDTTSPITDAAERA